jgi:uncharacterized membrane protein YgcG
MSGMGSHRVPVRGASLRRTEDPARSADLRTRELVARLRTLEPGPAPRSHFRTELRAQLVAVTPRLVAEGEAADTQPQAAPDKPRTVLGRLGHLPLARPLGIVASVLVVFTMLLGGAVWISHKALPGDPLYALKRANENVKLSLTHGTDRAKTYLAFAANRADEVQSLVPHSGRPEPSRDKLIRTTLASADGDVRAASQLLGQAAIDGRSSEPLRVMTNWAPHQINELQAITDNIRAGTLHDRTAKSTDLVRRALARAVALRGALGTDCLKNARTDGLGPVPPASCPSGSGAGSSGPSKPGSSSQNGGNGGASGKSSGGASGQNPAPSASPTPSDSAPNSGSGSTSHHAGPVGVSSCGVSASVGGIGVQIGSCTASSSP